MYRRGVLRFAGSKREQRRFDGERNYCAFGFFPRLAGRDGAGFWAGRAIRGFVAAPRAGLRFWAPVVFLTLGEPDGTCAARVAWVGAGAAAGVCTGSSATGGRASDISDVTVAGATGAGEGKGIEAGAGSFSATGGGAGKGGEGREDGGGEGPKDGGGEGGEVATGAGRLVLTSAVFSGACGSGVSDHKTRKPKRVTPATPKRKSLIDTPPPQKRRPTR
jgi:hypothetical protein